MPVGDIPLSVTLREEKKPLVCSLYASGGHHTMSRGSSRKRRYRKTVKAGKKLYSPAEGTESRTSAKYGSGGKVFGYNYRIAGPVFPVVTTKVVDDKKS